MPPIRRLAIFITLALIASLAFVPGPGLRGATTAVASEGGVKAGVGVVDATFHVGASAGQYAGKYYESEPYHNVDPYGHTTKNHPSYGIQSRLSARAIVVEGADGTRMALVKNDLYIPQDLLNTRVAQILADHDASVPENRRTGIDHANMMIAVSHNHSSPYYSSPSWGLFLFQDVFDIRFFEYLAQAMADAVIEASDNMVPVRMGATVSYFDHTQRHSFGPAIADDGTPAGYPQTDNDHSIGVIRFDDISDPARPRPLANFVTLGQHPEFLEGNNIITGDYVAATERMADLETGAVTVFAQNNTGTAEPDTEGRAHPLSERAEYSHKEYAQAERGARSIADVIVDSFQDIERRTPEFAGNFVSFTSDFPVMVNDKQLAPPYSHPYPSVSNCRTHEAASGNPGVPILGLPDCERLTGGALKPVWDQIPPPLNPGATYKMLREAGVPVPDNYGAPSYAGLQETFQVHLQVFRLGEVVITVCPCEQWSDQSLNIKTRLDKLQDNMWLGFDWSAKCRPTEVPNDPEEAYTCPHPGDPNKVLLVSEYEYLRMKAQVNNDAAGWDVGLESCNEPLISNGECPLRAESEPEDPKLIKGNYTHDEAPPGEGYDLVMPVGMANDYWGYIATYREYQRGDHYRKALTGLGAHSSDFLATRLVNMGRALKGGQDVARNPLDRAYEVDAQHQEARARIIGSIAQTYLAAYEAQLPLDAGSGAISEPSDITRFDATRFSWYGGSNYVDDPQVRVERFVDGKWVTEGDMTGDVVVTVDFPEKDELVDWRAGNFQWAWTATFEAFSSDIDTGRGHQTPAGTYRFVVDGMARTRLTGIEPYSFESEPFEVKPWDGITVPDIRVEDDGRVSFTVGPVNEKQASSHYPRSQNLKTVVAGPIDYPDTWRSLELPKTVESGTKIFPRVHYTYRHDAASGKDYVYCFSCTFRPWADTGEVATAWVTIRRADGSVERVRASRSGDWWITSARIYRGDEAVVEAGGILDTFGEYNGASSSTVAGTLDPPPPAPEEERREATRLKLRKSGGGRYLRARLVAAEDGGALKGAAIRFFVKRRFLKKARTNSNGIARVWLPRRYRAKRFWYRAVFRGNARYLRAADRLR